MERNAARPWIVRDLSVGEIAAVLLLATFVAGMLALQLREREPVSDAAFVQNYLLAEIPQIDPPGAAMRAVAVTSAVPETQDGENLAQTDIQLAASIIGQRSHDNGDDGVPIGAPASRVRGGISGGHSEVVPPANQLPLPMGNACSMSISISARRARARAIFRSASRSV